MLDCKQLLQQPEIKKKYRPTMQYNTINSRVSEAGVMCRVLIEWQTVGLTNVPKCESAQRCQCPCYTSTDYNICSGNFSVTKFESEI